MRCTEDWCVILGFRPLYLQVRRPAREAKSAPVVGETGEGRVRIQVQDAGWDVRRHDRVRQGFGNSQLINDTILLCFEVIIASKHLLAK